MVSITVPLLDSIGTRVARSNGSETGEVLATRRSRADEAVRPTIVERACQQKEQFLESRGSVGTLAPLMLMYTDGKIGGP